MEIRVYQHPQDYIQVIQLWEQAGTGIHIGRSDQPEEIAKKLSRDPDLFLIAEENQKIVGSVMGGFDGRRGLIYHLAVSLQYRKQGLGKALMKEVERRLFSKGCIRSYLLVIAENQDVIQFYKNLGWQPLPVITFAKDITQK